jgi:hypothetical protein
MAREQIFNQKDYSSFLHNLRGHKSQRPFMPSVKEERTGERDMELSLLHRKWGWDVPTVDIDFLEYDRANPIALIEYKGREDWETATVPRNSANLKALIKLAVRAKVPVFCVFYKPDHSMFRVIDLNSHPWAKPKTLW